VVSWAIDKIFANNFNRLLIYGLPTVAALIIIWSWPALDVESVAHDLLRTLGAPGHGFIDKVAVWLRAPERRGLIAPMPVIVGALFALGGANRPLGGGRSSAIAWMTALPLLVVEGRTAISGIIASWLMVTLMVLVLAFIFGRSDRTTTEAQFFRPSDVLTMAPGSIATAVAVPFAPALVLIGMLVASVSWPALRPIDDDTTKNEKIVKAA
jgi:hypothetical protein